MQGGNESFRFRQWRQQCPPTLNQLALLLNRFEENSKTLRSLLDYLIVCALKVDLELQNPPEGSNLYLSQLRKNLYHLLAMITDTPHFLVPSNETQEMVKERNYKLRVIQAKRQIDPTYLPNHLPDEEPDYLSPELYQEIQELNLETIERKKQQLDRLDEMVLEKDATELTRHPSLTRTQRIKREKRQAYLEEIQDTIRSTQSKHRAQPVSAVVNVEAERERRIQLLKKMENSLRATNYQRRVRKNILALSQGKLLKVDERYLLKEILPKMIEKDLQNPIPTKKDLTIFFEKVRNAIKLLDDLPIEEGVRLVLKTALEKELEEHIKFAEAKMENLEDYEEDAQLRMVPLIIKKAYIAFSNILSDYESPFPNNHNFDSVKKVLRDAQGKVDPVFLANEQRFRLRNPKKFVKPNPALQIKGNPHLDIRYLESEAREAHRVHIFKGKCYRFLRRNGILQMSLLNTEYHNSHLKEGWVSFVMNAQGEIFATSHQNKIVHSSFMKGGPVIFAGEMKVGKNGQILAVTDYSGHYTPQFENFQLFARHLHKRGVNLSSCDFYKIDDEFVDDKIREIDRSNYQRLSNLKAKVLRLKEASSSIGGEVGQAASLDTQNIKAELDRALLELKTAELEEEEAKQSVFQDSERLKYCHRYRFKDNELVPFSHTKAFLIAGLIILSLLGLGLGLSFLGLLIVASHGVALPVIGYGLAQLTVSISPTIIYGVGVAITTVITVVPSIAAVHIGGGFHAMGRGLKSLGQWCMGFIRKKDPPPGPEPAQGTSSASHPSTSSINHQQRNSGISTTLIHGLTTTGGNNEANPRGPNAGTGRGTIEPPRNTTTEIKHQKNLQLAQTSHGDEPARYKFLPQQFHDEEQNTISLST